nr:MAG TPA: hypothetical protein [Caudoviricetes sp.]
MATHHIKVLFCALKYFQRYFTPCHDCNDYGNTLKKCLNSGSEKYRCFYFSIKCSSTMSNTQLSPAMQARLLAIAANLAASMESNIKSIEETKQSLFSLLAKVPAEYRPNMSDVIAGADQAISEARQRLDRYQSLIA